MANIVIDDHFGVGFTIGVMQHNGEASQIMEDVCNAVEDAMVGKNFLKPAAEDPDGRARIEEYGMAAQSNIWTSCIKARRRVAKRRAN
jgi:hypothetical protein